MLAVAQLERRRESCATIDVRLVATLGVPSARRRRQLAERLELVPVLVQPRPWLFNVLFITIELTALMDVRRSGQTRSLWLLPPLFLIWACINIQFVYGLFILALAAADALSERWTGLADDTGSFRAKPLFLTLAGSVLATCLTPYHVMIYVPVVTAIRLTSRKGN